MPLISDVERRSARARMVYLTIYALLSLGSITMVYPLMIMVSTSMSSNADYEEYRLVPRYLHDDVALWRKFLEIRYDTNFTEFQHRYRIEEPIGDFRSYAGKMDIDVEAAGVRQRVADWAEFKKTSLPLQACDVFFTNKYRTGLTQKMYQEWLKKKYETIENYNNAFTTPQGFTAFNEVEYVPESLRGHTWPEMVLETKTVWDEFKATLPADYLRALIFSFAFQEYLRERFGAVQAMNRELGTRYQSFHDVEFTSRPPTDPGLDKVWDDYTTKRYPLRYARVPGDRLPEWKAFILSRAEFGRSPEGFNRLVMADRKQTAYHDYFSELKWTETIPKDEFLAQVWSRFVDTLPENQKVFLSTFEEYRKFLEKKYKTPERLNAAQGLSAAAFSEIQPPFREGDAVFFIDHRGQIKRQFAFGNFLEVLEYILFNGFAVRNTLILVLLWVGGHLTVQPMAAYALSRFRLRLANKILLFLLATMAFPQSVTMIPNFLLLKEMHLLNTYWALILPNLVQGIGIFLLKGYFDSLPDELYEAGMIDGASEFHMFWHITLPLSKPILAVIALQSFQAAYGSFMWAFLICQKERMWTLMVFLYQFQQYAAPYTHMAALVLAAIPTLVVFIFAQKIIMRGIVIPTMK